MSLQFIKGTSNMNLEKTLLKASTDWLDQDENHEVFYLVPNHMKFEQEINLLKQLKKQSAAFSESIATTRLQVFSFYRLAWYYLQNTKYYSSEMLTEAGAAMIFRKILVENEERLQVFRGEVNKAGFIQQLFDLYEELKEGNIAIEDLGKLVSIKKTEPKELDLQFKIQDLQLIFTQYEAQMSAYGIRSSEIIDSLCMFLAEQDLSQVLFIISGYHHFSARELQLLETLMKRGGQVKISLILDRKYTNEPPLLQDIFYETGSTYYQLYQRARQAKVEILADYTEQTNKLTQSQDIEVVEKYWIEAQKRVPMEKKRVKGDHVQVWCAENPKEEISHIAKEIRRLVVNGGYRYKDIQVVTRELNTYETLIEPIFKLHEIPLYLDRDMAMEQHPLVAFIQSLFAIHNYHYRYRDVLRFLRTELFIPELKEVDELDWLVKRDNWRGKVDRTENVVLAYGYEGYHWTHKKDWEFIRYDFEAGKKDDTIVLEQESNQIRQTIQETIPTLFANLQQAENGIEGATIFYRFLEEVGVEQQLMMWRNQAIEKGFLEEARNHEQTWSALMTLLDEYVTIYGKTPFELGAFQEIFTSGLEGLRYNKVPTAIDQVQVRAVDLAYPGQAKVIFAIGMTDQVLPQKIENKSLLSDEERGFVNGELTDDQFLLNNSRKSMAKEPFNAYILFSSATDRLYLTYPSVKDTMKHVKMSPYIENLRQSLGLTVHSKNALSILNDEQTSLLHIATYQTLIGELTNLKRQKIETQKKILPLWVSLEQSLMETSKNQFALRVFSSLTYKNIPENLGSNIAEELYGKAIYTSVSRMESFYRCQYQYFTRFGLGLKERDRFELSPAATGEFFHEALDQFFKLLILNDKQLTSLTDKEVEQFTEEILTAVFGETKFSILNSSSRMNYIRYQLGQTIKKVSWALKKQSERSGMSTIQTEILFGQIASHNGIKGLELPLNNNGKISVRGKIDRLDQLVTPETIYLSVVDYKSSHKKFNITEAYYGLAMQMLTYLDVALIDAVRLVGQPAKPAGSLYLHVQNPTLPFITPDQAEKQILKKFQYDGLLVNDPVLIENLDKSLEAKQSSLLFPIEESAKEIIKPGRRQEDKFVSESELDSLIKHNRSKFIEAGNKIIGGDIALNPAYQGKERVACRYCPFRSICDFDVMLQENNYHRIEQLSKKEVMDRLTNDEQEAK